MEEKGKFYINNDISEHVIFVQLMDTVDKLSNAVIIYGIWLNPTQVGFPTPTL